MRTTASRIALYPRAAPLVRRVALNSMAAGAEGTGVDLALNAGLMDSARPRGDRLEDAMQRRISHFLRIPPPDLNEKLVNTTGRISPAGLARQEMREEERGLCKIRRYNPDMLRPITMAGYLEASRRLAQVVAAVSVLAFALLRTETTATAAKVQADAVKVRETLTNMGATFVKVGQVLANRPDIIRADYMEELTKLQDQVPPFPSKIAFEMMEAGLGCPPSELFDDITPEPLAAASLGQVYKAKLKKNGREVAIKVQRPGVAELIKRDVYLLRLIAKGFNEEAVKRIGVDAVTLLDEFAENLLEELDYTQEATNILSFQANFFGDHTVKIPDVYPELSSEKILVMEWIDGVRCTDTEEIGKIGVPILDFIRVGVDSQTRQLLEFGLFHGDPHPGNIFALRDGRIAYVDFGSVAEISQVDKETLVDCVVYAMDEDFLGIAEAMSRLGFIMPGTDLEPISRALEKMWTDAVGRDMRDFNLRTVTREFSKLVYEYPIRVPERFALVIRTLLSQEGICLTLDPDFKLLEVAYPCIAKRLIRDPTYSNRLPQVLLKENPLSSKPIFDFRRLFSLLSMAASVAGSGDLIKGLSGLGGTLVDGGKLLLKKPRLGVELGRGMLRWVRTKLYEGVRWFYRGCRSLYKSSS